MLPSLLNYLKSPRCTADEIFPDLSAANRGLPAITSAPCTHGEGCTLCADGCPTKAIELPTDEKPEVALDLGKCVGCGHCMRVCPTKTIVTSRSTRTAVKRREDLVLRAGRPTLNVDAAHSPFKQSVVVRYVSTGDNATDLEVAACTNPIFDASRFGIHFTASPRFADVLLVAGPAPLAMQEPLCQTLHAMGQPRVIIAVGAQAISGGMFCGGYANANGVSSVLQPDVWVPGNPPHPWMILHGLLLAMGHPLALHT